MKLSTIMGAVALLSATLPTVAQETVQRVEITGSSIKQRIDREGALPVQVITIREIEEQGVTSVEQLISTLTVNGNGLDNLASNSDVVAGAARGNNGATSANLRNQGSAATLILLNGRRVAAHGLNGGAVDLNQIPFAALQRVEILKDGASAIYGTDAIGGVINFITRTDYQGLEVGLAADVTQAGGGNIYKANLTGGFGSLDKDKYNLLFTLAVRDHKILRGSDRDFVNTFQSDRGLSVDTRGTPFATIFARAGSLLPASVAVPGGGTQTYNGINVLDLPGGAGCDTYDGMGAYDQVLWNSPASAYGCAWDTGRAATIQQPVTGTNLLMRGTARLGEHQVVAELMGSRTESAKAFSNLQLSTSNARPFLYPSTGSAYDTIFNQMVAVFPTLASNYGRPIAYRYRCMVCGPREIETTADTGRLLLALDGPLGGGWDYKTGASYAFSKVKSTLGSGYYYFDADGSTSTVTPGDRSLLDAINSGLINVFDPNNALEPGAQELLDRASARGVTLYGGKYSVTELDFTATGPVFKLPAGDVYMAAGMNFRREAYDFNGDSRASNARPEIYLAPFDDANALDGTSRNVKAVFAEVQVPITKRLDLNLAARYDDYDNFGSTTNPKVSLRFQPLDTLMTRASYSTGFRVPTFNQLFNGVTESTYVGADMADPATCPTGTVDSTVPGCASITPEILTGGKSDLGPEKSKQWTAGFVWAPIPQFSFGADWWSIRRTGTIQSLSLTTLLANYTLFPERFLRDGSGNLLAIDNRWINAGETITKGVDINVQGNTRAFGAKWTAQLQGTYLTDKRSRLLPSVDFGASEVAQFTRAGDLGLRWKHALTFKYERGVWGAALIQQYSTGYKDYQLPGVANGSVTPVNWKAYTDDYTLYHASVTYTGVKNLSLTVGVKNLLDTDPPFAAAYDTNTGAGSSWDPRVADPRGRSLVLSMNYKFW